MGGIVRAVSSSRPVGGSAQQSQERERSVVEPQILVEGRVQYLFELYPVLRSVIVTLKASDYHSGHCHLTFEAYERLRK